MRHSIIVAGLVAAFLTTTALAAEMRIAVVDTQTALMSSDVAKKSVEKLQGEVKVQRDRMAQLKTEVDALQTRAQKEGAVMSDKDKKELQKQGEGKIQEFNNLAQMVEKRTQEVRNELLQRLIPKLEVIIEEMQKANKYDIILEKKGVLYTDPSVDLTKKVTEKLNAAK